MSDDDFTLDVRLGPPLGRIAGPITPSTIAWNATAGGTSHHLGETPSSIGLWRPPSEPTSLLDARPAIVITTSDVGQ